MVRSARTAAAALVGTAVALLTAGCGTHPLSFGAPALGPDARSVLLQSGSRTTATSYRMHFVTDETISVSGPQAPQAGALNGAAIHLDMSSAVESAGRVESTVTSSGLGSSPIRAKAVLYDGAAFLSTDGGTSYRSFPQAAAAASQFGSENALQYLDTVGTVTDRGPAIVEGIAVERYTADVDGARMAAVIRKALAGLGGTSSSGGAAASRIFDALRVTGGHIEVTVDRAGRVVGQAGTVDCTLDLSGADPGLAGTVVTLHEAFDGRFSDYGAPITVARPANVTGTASV